MVIEDLSSEEFKGGHIGPENPSPAKQCNTVDDGFPCLHISNGHETNTNEQAFKNATMCTHLDPLTPSGG